jgi:hypothetical protein
MSKDFVLHHEGRKVRFHLADDGEQVSISLYEFSGRLLLETEPMRLDDTLHKIFAWLETGTLGAVKPRTQ